MTIDERNSIFIEYENLIWFTIHKNLPLIRALRLDLEDVSQDLTISAFKAIEAFDPSRGKKLHNFILYKLQFEILNIRERLNRGCRVANIAPFSIDDTLEDGATIDIPITVDYDSRIAVNELLSLLNENEKEVVELKMSGAALTEKKQRRQMDRVRKKITRFYALRSV